MVKENNENHNGLGEFKGEIPAGITVPYSIPKDYFNQSANLIMARVLNEEGVLGIAKNNPYALPTGYFDNLTDQITQRVIVEEKENQGVKLANISRKMPFAVPNDYFEDKKATEKKTIVLPFNLNNKLRKAMPIFRFVAAAAFAVFILKGNDLSILNKPKPQTEENNKIDLDAKLNKLSDEELSRYMDNSQLLSQPIEPSGSDLDNLSNIVENLQNLSDEELQQYLNENDTQRPVKGI